ncbi:protein-L-isoaspartate(D-aspartate) O-methyltransferase [Xylophilus sp. GOD-11R]|uniref:protein-L-isoaspartate(D-aspartate) O-methyltransferase n=1 Tax=Xylophilus sp. GOD-11R TaxID=3089814 RepID=UPI00298BD096|nr:protein-L-isoaspartate(D-aspartate) O-methyltransferase [Xylophilus sp. GOD-11R]WPB58027.1 protein-L-isoaspartate(D-aspartate) O-methyltransferase [Xylophilus sp. GOD-11R]
MSDRPSFPARLPGRPGHVSTEMSTRRQPVAPSVPGKEGGSVGESDFAHMRAHMVRKIEAQGVGAAAVLHALNTVHRHRFIDPALIGQAYEDTSLPIGLGQTISKPGVVARMCELLLGARIAQGGSLGRVLEIGTGCGYQAAVLSLVVQEVYSIERLRALHEKARANLRPFRIPNIHLLFGDGIAGYAKGAPYAGIIAAAGGDALPDEWCEQLAVGGRLVAPIAGQNGRQALVVVDRGTMGFQRTTLEDVHFVPLKSGIA